MAFPVDLPELWIFLKIHILYGFVRLCLSAIFSLMLVFHCFVPFLQDESSTEATLQLTRLEMWICLVVPSVVDMDWTLDLFEPAVVAGPTLPAETFLTHFETLLTRWLGVVHQWSTNILAWRVAINCNTWEFTTFCLLVVIISQWLEMGIIVSFHVRCYKGPWFKCTRLGAFLPRL